MDKVFVPLLYKGIEIYLDNILIHSETTVEHVDRVLSMLQCLKNTVLYCVAKKCKFDKKKIEFLGVNVSQDGFEMEDKKIANVLNWQQPTSVQGVCEFIGFVNFYHQWIPKFANIA